MDKTLLSPNVFQKTKRDRPISSFLESPSDDIDLYLQQQHNQLQESDDDENFDTPIKSRKNKVMLSPLVSRKPFKNLSNLMNLGSMKKKFSSSSFIKRGKIEEEEADTTVSTIEDLDINDSDSEGDRGENADAEPDLEATDSRSGGVSGVSATVGTSEVSGVSGNSAVSGALTRAPKPSGPERVLRRFHSMYQTNKEKDVALSDDNSLLKLSNIQYFKTDDDSIPRIDVKSFHKLINHQFNHKFDDLIIIDCRFDYEFNGGHIKNAINISDKQELEDIFINDLKYRNDKKKLIIFHCEFSIFRGPTMASHLRRSDRILNLSNYPHLSYPDILILDGGYKRFFETYKSSCEPQNYVEMKDSNHIKKCNSDLDKFRSISKLNDHNRSTSFTTITLHAENLKILKRQRSSSNFKPQPQEPKLTRSSTFSFPSTSLPQEDFLPPMANFLKFNQSSNSLNSLNSSLSELSTFSSNDSQDSISISNSPIVEMNEFFESSSQTTVNSSLNSNLSKYKKKKSTGSNSSTMSKTIVDKRDKDPFKFPSINNNTISMSPFNKKGLTISTSSSSGALSTSSNNTITVPGHFKNNSITSPIMSSPLSSMTPLPTPMSTIDTSISRHHRTQSIIDPINDTPVDFQVPSSYKK